MRAWWLSWHHVLPAVLACFPPTDPRSVALPFRMHAQQLDTFSSLRKGNDAQWMPALDGCVIRDVPAFAATGFSGTKPVSSMSKSLLNQLRASRPRLDPLQYTDEATVVKYRAEGEQSVKPSSEYVGVPKLPFTVHFQPATPRSRFTFHK